MCEPRHRLGKQPTHPMLSLDAGGTLHEAFITHSEQPTIAMYSNPSITVKDSDHKRTAILPSVLHHLIDDIGRPGLLLIVLDSATQARLRFLQAVTRNKTDLHMAPTAYGPLSEVSWSRLDPFHWLAKMLVRRYAAR